MIRVTEQPVDAADELRQFLGLAGEGAIASFVGTVRGGNVEALTLDHYSGFTEKELERIVEQVADRHSLSSTIVVHRFGAMLPGETIMFAATAAPHRRAALDALDELMDRLKSDAPFWKRELRGGEEHWLEPPADAGSAAATGALR